MLLPHSPENDLLERIQSLFRQLKHTRLHSPEYEQLSIQIDELSLTYSRLIESRHPITQHAASSR
jgi:hypothetical protein